MINPIRIIPMKKTPPPKSIKYFISIVIKILYCLSIVSNNVRNPEPCIYIPGQTINNYNKKKKKCYGRFYCLKKLAKKNLKKKKLAKPQITQPKSP